MKEKQLTVKKNIISFKISVVIPDTSVNPEEILNTVADTDFYILKEVKLSEFVTRQFIEGFIKRGKF